MADHIRHFLIYQPYCIALSSVEMECVIIGPTIAKAFGAHLYHQLFLDAENQQEIAVRGTI